MHRSLPQSNPLPMELSLKTKANLVPSIRKLEAFIHPHIPKSLPFGLPSLVETNRKICLERSSGLNRFIVFLTLFLSCFFRHLVYPTGKLHRAVKTQQNAYGMKAPCLPLFQLLYVATCAVRNTISGTTGRIDAMETGLTGTRCRHAAMSALR